MLNSRRAFARREFFAYQNADWFFVQYGAKKRKDFRISGCFGKKFPKKETAF